jgi:LysM repeat protein
MANPNIVNVTDIRGKTTYAALTTTLTTVLLANAVSSGKVFKINSIMVANVDGTSDANVSVDINTAADGSGTSYALANTIVVPADATLSVIDKTNSFYLEEDKSILGGANADSDLEIIISYEEIS